MERETVGPDERAALPAPMGDTINDRPLRPDVPRSTAVIDTHRALLDVLMDVGAEAAAFAGRPATSNIHCCDISEGWRTSDRGVVRHNS